MTHIFEFSRTEVPVGARPNSLRSAELEDQANGPGDEAQTRDPYLGNVAFLIPCSGVVNYRVLAVGIQLALTSRGLRYGHGVPMFRPSERAEGVAVNELLDRRLVAVMFTDMVGYTAMVQADERLGVDKRDRYVSALESHHNAFGGTIVQRLGDGSIAPRIASVDPHSHACTGSHDEDRHHLLCGLTTLTAPGRAE